MHLTKVSRFCAPQGEIVHGKLFAMCVRFRSLSSVDDGKNEKEPNVVTEMAPVPQSARVRFHTFTFT